MRVHPTGGLAGQGDVAKIYLQTDVPASEWHWDLGEGATPASSDVAFAAFTIGPPLRAYHGTVSACNAAGCSDPEPFDYWSGYAYRLEPRFPIVLQEPDLSSHGSQSAATAILDQTGRIAVFYWDLYADVLYVARAKVDAPAEPSDWAITSLGSHPVTSRTATHLTPFLLGDRFGVFVSPWENPGPQFVCVAANANPLAESDWITLPVPTTTMSTACAVWHDRLVLVTFPAVDSEGTVLYRARTLVPMDVEADWDKLLLDAANPSGEGSSFSDLQLAVADDSLAVVRDRLGSRGMPTMSWTNDTSLSTSWVTSELPQLPGDIGQLIGSYHSAIASGPANWAVLYRIGNYGLRLATSATLAPDSPEDWQTVWISDRNPEVDEEGEQFGATGIDRGSDGWLFWAVQGDIGPQYQGYATHSYHPTGANDLSYAIISGVMPTIAPIAKYVYGGKWITTPDSRDLFVFTAGPEEQVSPFGLFDSGFSLNLYAWTEP
ncbi:MAG: hypothetical protein ABI743_00945 [bacterium]